jgi:hypothetical protein
LSTGLAGEVLVVGAAGQVPGHAPVRAEVSGKTAVVHEAVVHEVVVVAAEQGGVGEVGAAAVEPVGQVVRVAPGKRL